MTKEKLSVLIVEDDASVRETLREFLLSKGLRVTVARDGVEAAGLLRNEEPFDVVLSDLRLPAGDGVQVLRDARERNPLGYVILITGFASLESAIEAVRLGAFDYLVKPFSLSELDLALGRIREHRTLRRSNELLAGRLRRLKRLGALLDGQAAIRERLDAIEQALGEHRRLLDALVDATKAALVGAPGPRER